MTTPDAKPILVFTIEIAARELTPKCLLALEAARRGFRVYICSFRAAKQLKGKVSRCVFFHNSGWENNALRLKKEIGAKFVFLDEEMGFAIPRSNLPNHLARRYQNVTKEKYSDIFAIGDHHKALMLEFDNFKEVAVHAYGWPRIDLWRSEFHELFRRQTQTIKDELGSFYLLVSSFGAINERTYRESVHSRREHYGSDTRIIDFKYDEFKQCRRLLEELSHKLNDHERIVIRPHQSESVEDWKKIVSDIDKVLIRKDGDIYPWILACKGTIQFGSTVSVQAAYMGIPSIQIKIGDMENITDTIAYEVLHNTVSSEEVYHHLANASQADSRDQVKKAKRAMKGWVNSLEDDLAASKIAAKLWEIRTEPQLPIRFGPFKRFVLYFKEKVNYLNYLKKKKLRPEASGIKRSKFEKIPNGLAKRDIEEQVKKMASILGDDTSRIKCRQAAHNLVEIEFD